MTLILSLVLSAWLGEKFIQYMRKRKIGETQRDASIDPFGEKKVGTPSMGGIVIITAILLPVLLLGRMRNIYIILMIITTVWLGFLGFCDDYIKIYRKHKEKIGSGFYFGFCIATIFTFRFFIEFCKEVQVDFEQGMTFDMGQLLSIPFIIGGLWLIFRSRKK